MGAAYATVTQRAVRAGCANAWPAEGGGQVGYVPRRDQAFRVGAHVSIRTSMPLTLNIAAVPSAG